MSETWAQRAPWFGIAAVVCALLAIIIGGETPGVHDSAAKIADFYDDTGQQETTAGLIALTALFFTFFAAAIRARVRELESLSTLIMVGGAIFALGVAIFAAVQFTLADLLDTDKHIDPGALQALNAANTDFFFPTILGLAVFYFSTAVAILSSATLPRWFGWVTLVLAVLTILGPLGFLAFVLTLPWTLVASILLMRPPQATPGTPPPPGDPVAS
jgi:hypothetical protein